VAAEFAKLGCAVIDADEIAHKLLDEPAIKNKVVAAFGDNILGPDGKIGRKKLGNIVFAEKKKLLLLEKIIHPYVLKRAEKLIRQYNRRKQVKAIVLDMPLLAEVGWDKRCDRIIFVDCKQQLRVKRAKKSGTFSKNQLKIRENLQISLDKKAGIAENTIDNNSGFSALAGQVAEIFSCIMDNR
jgi:dephospho-CoA kinase